MVSIRIRRRAPQAGREAQTMDIESTSHTTFFRKAEAALRASEARMTAIMEAALDCIVTIDHEGRILDFNPAAQNTFGYTQNEAVGHEMADLIIPPHLRERHRQGLAHAVRSGEDRIVGKRIEITAMRSDGTEFP